MNIKYITNARIPTEKAHGLQIAKMCEAYGSLGHDLTLVLPERVNNITEDIFAYYDLKKVFNVKYIKTFNFINYKHFGWMVYHFHNIFFAFSARKLLSKNDILITRTPLIAWFFSVFGYTTVYECHNWPESKKSSILLSFALRKSSLVVANSEGTAKAAVDSGLRLVIVAHNAVDVDKFNTDISSVEAKALMKISDNKRIVMYIGSLAPWKGVKTLLDASELLPKKYQVVIVGGSDSEVKKIKNKYQRVFFYGSSKYKDLPWIQKAADFLVVTNTKKSVESVKYTSPIKIFAHMLSGVPMVLSRLPSIEKIISKEEAYFFDPDNEHSLAECILEIDKDQIKAIKKTKNAFKVGIKNTWKNRAKHIISSIV